MYQIHADCNNQLYESISVHVNGVVCSEHVQDLGVESTIWKLKSRNLLGRTDVCDEAEFPMPRYICNGITVLQNAVFRIVL